MTATQCPICFGTLEVRDVAPCADCGHMCEEIEHLRQRVHTYTELEVISEQRLILCDFCRVDFYSYDPAYFGLGSRRELGRFADEMRLIRQLHEPSLGKDGYCPSCDRRLVFLKLPLFALIWAAGAIDHGLPNPRRDWHIHKCGGGITEG